MIAMRAIIAGVLVGCLCAMPAFATVQRFSCVFKERVSQDMDTAVPEKPLRIEFIVDETGHAFAVGRNVFPVRSIVGDQGITFLEELSTGAVQSTTILPDGKAAHSRHTILLGEFMPSQYYGTCEAKSD